MFLFRVKQYTIVFKHSAIFIKNDIFVNIFMVCSTQDKYIVWSSIIPVMNLFVKRNLNSPPFKIFPR